MLVPQCAYERPTCSRGTSDYTQVKVSPEVTLQQGAAHHRDEIHSPVAVKCSSCGKTSPSNSSHPVHYKTIIAHFEQVKGPDAKTPRYVCTCSRLVKIEYLLFF